MGQLKGLGWWEIITKLWSFLFVGKSMFSSTLYVWLDPSYMIFRYLDVYIYNYIYISPYVYSCVCCISICSRYAYMFIYISHLYGYISVVSICLVPLMPEVPKTSIYMLYIFRYVKRFFCIRNFQLFSSPPHWTVAGSLPSKSAHLFYRWTSSVVFLCWDLQWTEPCYGDEWQTLVFLLGKESRGTTLLGSNISPFIGTFEDYFPFPVWWDMWSFPAG